jgi:hypothetical protein
VASRHQEQLFKQRHPKVSLSVISTTFRAFVTISLKKSFETARQIKSSNMSFSLPDQIVLPTSPERHNLAIAEIVIFSIVLPIQLCVRFVQIRRRRQRSGRKNVVVCLFRASLNFVVIFTLSTSLLSSAEINAPSTPSSTKAAQLRWQKSGE